MILVKVGFVVGLLGLVLAACGAGWLSAGSSGWPSGRSWSSGPCWCCWRFCEPATLVLVLRRASGPGFFAADLLVLGPPLLGPRVGRGLLCPVLPSDLAAPGDEPEDEARRRGARAGLACRAHRPLPRGAPHRGLALIRSPARARPITHPDNPPT